MYPGVDFSDEREQFVFEITSEYPLIFKADVGRIAREYSRFVYNFGNPYNWELYYHRRGYFVGDDFYMEDLPDPLLWVDFICKMLIYCTENGLPMEIHFNGQGLFDGQVYLGFDYFVKEELERREIYPNEDCYLYFNGIDILNN